MKLPKFSTQVTVIAVLVVALLHAQLGWRSDRRVFDTLLDEHNELRRKSAFLAAGDAITDSELRVVRNGDTLLLSDLVAGKGRIIYFGRSGCLPCDWFGARMDSIFPTWGDSVLFISSVPGGATEMEALHLDSLGARLLPAVPTLLVVDASGAVTHSAVGLKRMLAILNHVGFPSPSVAQLLSERVIQPDPASVSRE